MCSSWRHGRRTGGDSALSRLNERFEAADLKAERCTDPGRVVLVGDGSQQWKEQAGSGQRAASSRQPSSSSGQLPFCTDLSGSSHTHPSSTPHSPAEPTAAPDFERRVPAHLLAAVCLSLTRTLSPAAASLAIAPPSTLAMSSSADSIPLLIKNPHSPDYVFSTNVPSPSSVFDVKSHLASAYRGSPAASSQWLVCAGRLLSDGERLSDVYASQAAGGSHELILHLAIKQQRTATVPPSISQPQPQPSQQRHNTSSASPMSAAATSVSASPASSTPTVSAGDTLPAAASSSATATAAVASSSLTPPLPGYAMLPYAMPSVQQLQLAWQWQQMAAAAQLGGLRQRQVSAPTAPSQPAASSPHSAALQANTALSPSSALFPSLAGGASAVSPFHSATAAAALRTAPAPFFFSPFGMPATNPLTPHLSMAATSALPPFGASSAAALPSAANNASSTFAPTHSLPGSAPFPATANFSTAPPQPPSAFSPAAASASSSSPAAAVAIRPSAASAYVTALRRYVDVRLLLKLSVLLLVFSRQGDSTRSLLLMGAAVLAYLWQVGLLRRRDREAGGGRQGDGEAAHAGAARGAAGNDADGGVAEREAMAHARREAREERRAGAAGGGGGLGGLLAGMAGEADEDDLEEDIHLQREQLHMLQQQHQAELIRRGQRQPGEAGEAGQGAVELDTWMSATEKLVVGLFASLVPSWRPTIDVQ